MSRNTVPRPARPAAWRDHALQPEGGRGAVIRFRRPPDPDAERFARMLGALPPPARNILSHLLPQLADLDALGRDAEALGLLDEIEAILRDAPSEA